jgi:hypothetical protein
MIHIIAVALLLLVKVRNVADHVQAELKLWPASIGHLKISAERPKISFHHVDLHHKAITPYRHGLITDLMTGLRWRT